MARSPTRWPETRLRGAGEIRLSHRPAKWYRELGRSPRLVNPRHPYSQALLSAIPRIGRKTGEHIRLKGEVPTPIHLPSGCVFHGRCIYADPRCREEVPSAGMMDDGVLVACHGVEEGRI